MKRLARRDRSSRFAQPSDSRALREVASNWQRLGIQPQLVYLFASRVQRERRMHEAQLDAGTRRRKQLERHLAHAQPLFEMLRTEETEDGERRFEGLVGEADKIQRAVEAWIHSLRIPTGRPSEPWRVQPILELGAHLRASLRARRRASKRMGWPRVADELHTFFVAAGQGEVVSKSQIEHTLRGHKAAIDSRPCRWFLKPVDPSGYGLR